jgi:N-acetylmuramic acid 6-phosphate etherase
LKTSLFGNHSLMKSEGNSSSPLFLGIECGGTRTLALLAQDGIEMKRVEAGAANLQLLSDAELLRHFRLLSGSFLPPAALAIGMAGARTERDRERIRIAASKVWPKVPCYPGHDLEMALLAGQMQTARDKAAPKIPMRRNRGTEDRSRERQLSAQTHVLVLSGTGSCCYGRTVAGAEAKIGGWGHILGDKGSGYEIGLRALRAIVYYYDRDQIWSLLGQRILRVLQLNEPNELIGWAQRANKTEIAALAIEVFQAWAKRDKIATDILAGASHSLAKDAVSCAKRLVTQESPVQFILAGSVLLKQPRFAREVANHLRELWSSALVTCLKNESVWGAIELAKRHFESLHRIGIKMPIAQAQPCSRPSKIKSARRSDADVSLGSNFAVPESSKLSPTEQRNPRSTNLDKLPLAKAILLMLSEDAKVPRAVLTQRKRIECAIRIIERAFRQEGRLFYVGAGTSGRLGVLDASECPPTFGTPLEQVQGIMAGGQRALWQSVEGAEDDSASGAAAINGRGITKQDAVVGIAASGRTAFVWGALMAAKGLGARTILICFNPYLKIPRSLRPDLVIAPNVGPEVLTGSTRLKAGTATKLILNLLTTLSMVQLGKVSSNLMIDLNPSNRKLRDRAIRITQELTGADYSASKRALAQSKWVVKSARARLLRRKS